MDQDQQIAWMTLAQLTLPSLIRAFLLTYMWIGGCCWLLVVGSLSVASNAIGGQVQGTPVYGYFFIFCLAEVFTITIAAGGVKVFACSSI